MSTILKGLFLSPAVFAAATKQAADYSITFTGADRLTETMICLTTSDDRGYSMHIRKHGAVGPICNCEPRQAGVYVTTFLDGDVVINQDVANAEICAPDYSNNLKNAVIAQHIDQDGAIKWAANGGGYEAYLYFITADGACLAIETVIAELGQVDFNDPDDPQWYIEGAEVNYESEIYDDHTGQQIPQAY